MAAPVRYDGSDSKDVKTALSETLIFGNGGDDVLVAVNKHDATSMFGGDGNDDLTLSVRGGAFGQVKGNDGDDFIGGGFFDDLLYGGNGNDTIAGAQGHDTIYGGSGNDKIYGFIQPVNKPDSADDLFGDDGNDKVRGNAGADKIHGGSGDDKLTGNNGADTFYFETKLDANKNVDGITDFSAGKDTIALSSTIFDVGAAGTLDPNLFVVGKKAADADDRIIYDPKTGNVYYNSNGNVKGHQVEFAHLDRDLHLKAADFLIF